MDIIAALQKDIRRAREVFGLAYPLSRCEGGLICVMPHVVTMGPAALFGYRIGPG